MGNQTLPFLMTRTGIAAMTHFYYSLGLDKDVLKVNKPRERTYVRKYKTRRTTEFIILVGVMNSEYQIQSPQCKVTLNKDA